MANVVPNSGKDSTKAHLLSTSSGNLENVTENTLEGFEEKRKLALKSNASIINVDNDCYELIPSRYFPGSEFHCFNKNIEEIDTDILFSRSFSDESNFRVFFAQTV